MHAFQQQLFPTPTHTHVGPSVISISQQSAHRGSESVSAERSGLFRELLHGYQRHLD